MKQTRNTPKYKLGQPLISRVKQGASNVLIGIPNPIVGLFRLMPRMTWAWKTQKGFVEFFPKPGGLLFLRNTGKDDNVQIVLPVTSVFPEWRDLADIAEWRLEGKTPVILVKTQKGGEICLNQ